MRARAMLSLCTMNEAKRDAEEIDPVFEEAGREELRRRHALIDQGETELVLWDDVRAHLLSK